MSCARVKPILGKQFVLEIVTRLHTGCEKIIQNRALRINLLPSMSL